MSLGEAFDLLLAAGLVGVAAAVVVAGQRVRGTALFVVFGLVMSITWIRLDAADIALAEAAVGAGITGALLLDAARELDRRQPAEPPQ